MSIFIEKTYKEIETSMPGMQNLLTNILVFIINMCGSEIKNIFSLSLMCYIVDVYFLRNI